ncbi:hypothetical protein [Candidatus Enterovibrio escicola]|uniref:Mobile element protein n=1 Tax=Candidatus Enterovibrio escicola TaxID=1927127 RepID=A0A2A5T581_9GAMM|nr:hypothetical protein [Candidatus Enterovibrio escacola]PCS23322.1 hypothetical protein BTN49_1319 [Candidatus Enterovibrio escacola]
METTPNFLLCQRKKHSRFSVTEVRMTVIAFHQLGYRNFKTH